MGFRQAAVLGSVSFFLGVLFICLNVDYRILWALDDKAVEDGFVFYTTFYHAPPAIRALLHGVIGVGLVSLVLKLHKWDESAIFFDGGSIAVYVCGIIMYLSVSIPAVRTVVEPLADVDTREDQIQAMQVLSAANTIIVGLLGLVLTLQGGQEYARRLEAKSFAAIEAEEKRKAVEVPAEKKEQ